MARQDTFYLNVQEVQTRLQTLAMKPLLKHHSEQLQRLSRDLTDPDRAATWAETNLTEMFLISEIPSELESDSPRFKTAEGVGVVFIFLPLLITWLGLYLATRAYATVPASETRPFIALWELGFPSYDGLVLRLSLVAILDVIVIGILIVATLFVHFERARLDRSNDRALNETRHQLSAALIDASLIVAQKKYSSPQRFQTMLNESAGQLADLVNSLRSAAATADGAMGRVAKASDRMVQAGSSLEAASAGAALVAADLATTASTLSGPITGLDNSLAKMQAAIAGHSDALVSSSGALDLTLVSLGVASETARSQLQELAPLVSKVMALEKKLVDKIDKTLTDQQVVAAGVTEAAIQIASLQQTAAASATSAAQATHQALDASRGFATHMDHSLAGVETLTLAQQQFAQLLRSTNASVEVGANRLRTDLEQLHLVLKWLSDLSSNEAPLT